MFHGTEGIILFLDREIKTWKSLDGRNIEENFRSSCFVLGGIPSRAHGVTLVSVLRNHFLQSLGTIWDGKGSNPVNPVKDQYSTHYTIGLEPDFSTRNFTQVV